MKLCVISYHTSPLASPGSDDAGGMNIMIYNLYQRLAKNIDTDIFVAGRPKITQLVPGLRLISLPSVRFDDFANQVCNYHEKFHYDVIHTHYWFSGLIGEILKHRLKLPWVHNFHTIEIFKKITYNQIRVEIEDAIMKQCDCIISATVRESYRIKERHKKTRVSVIPHGVDIKKFKMHANGHRDILFVGRLDPIKGFDLLIPAMKLLPQDIELKIIGGPSKGFTTFNELKSYRNQLCISLLGPINHNHLPYYYKNASMLVVPSHYESFGLSTLEAMACGRPVIGFADTDIVEIVGHNAGILVRRDFKEIAKAIKFLQDNPNLRYELGKNGRKKALFYNWDNTTKRYLRIYEEINKK